MKIKLTLTEDMLATRPADDEVFDSYVATKAPDDDKRKEELGTLESVEERGTTVFPRDENGAFLWDYQIKGFLKEGGDIMRQALGGGKGSKWGAIKKKMDNMAFVLPRRVYIQGMNGDAEFCQRPLRAQTMQGERISLARSEVAPEGCVREFEIDRPLGDKIITDEMLGLILDYGKHKGLGQWRNSGKGRFSWEKV